MKILKNAKRRIIYDLQPKKIYGIITTYIT